MKNICCVIHSPPYRQQRGQSALDFILAASNMTSQISVIFFQAGVWQIVRNQQPDCIGLKNYTAGFAALPLYDITQIYVHADALAQRKLNQDALLLTTQSLDTPALQALLQQQHCVVYF